MPRSAAAAAAGLLFLFALVLPGAATAAVPKVIVGEDFGHVL